MRLKDNVGDYFGFPQLREGRSVGIEIEIESNNRFPPRRVTDYYWNREHDGSLRGVYNAEYVLKNPLKKQVAMKALDKLSLVLKENNTKVNDSVRAGTHVHINVRDLSFLEMWSLVTCWYVMEGLLTHTMCGEGRVGNHFCLGAEDADAVLFVVRRVLKGANVCKLGEDDIRYSALNFVALGKYGSLEFRAMRTPQDFKEIKLWVNILLALKENSKLFPNPRHVVENFSFGGERNFLRAILGNENAEMVIARDPDGWRTKLKKGVRIAQEIAYAKDDWDKEEKEKLPIRRNRKKAVRNIEEFADMFGIRVDNVNG